MQNESTRVQQIISRLFPWLFIVPIGLCVLTIILISTPTNVLSRYGRLLDIWPFIPISGLVLGVSISLLGFMAARRWGLMSEWRRKATLVLSIFFVIIAGGTVLTAILGTIWILIRIAFFGFSV